MLTVFCGFLLLMGIATLQQFLVPTCIYNFSHLKAPFTTVEFIASESSLFELVAFVETPGEENAIIALFPGHFNQQNPCSTAEPLKVMKVTLFLVECKTKSPTPKMVMHAKLRKGFYYTFVLSLLPPLRNIDYSLFVRPIPSRSDYFED